MAAAIAVVTIVLSAIVGLSARTPIAAVHDTLAETPYSSTSAVLGMDLADSPGKQDATVGALLAARFRSAPLDVQRMVVSDAWPLADGSPGTSTTADAPTLLFIADDAVMEARVSTVSGSLAELDTASSPNAPSSTAPTSTAPTSNSTPTTAPVPVAIDATGARALQVAVGDTVRIQLDRGVRVLRVVAVFAARSPSGLAWVSAAPGADGSTARVLAAPGALSDLGSTPTVRYAVAPRASSARPADLDSYATGFRSLAAAADRSPALGDLQPVVTGDGIATITSMQDSLRATSAVIPVPIAVLAVSSLIALLLLAQLVAASRENETRLLRARGGSLGLLMRVSAIESAIVAAVGTVTGAVVAQVGLLLWVGASPTGVDAIIPALATFVAAVLCAVGVSFRATVLASGAPRPESDRARAAGSVSVTVLLVAAAGITIWRFLVYGTPQPGQPADPVGIFAPAAALCAIAMLALVLLGPLARAIERSATRTTGVGSVLPSRQLGRSLGLFAAPVALLVLAVGASVFAATYVGTWSGLLSGSARLVAGSDLSVAVENAPVVGSDPTFVDRAGYGAIAGVTATAPVLSTGAQVGDQTVTVVGVAASRLPSLVSVDPRMLDVPALQRMLVARAPTGVAAGLPIPAGASEITLNVLARQSSTVAAATVSPTLWIEDAQGDLDPIGLPATAVAESPTPVSLTARLPAGGPWRAVALDVGIHAPESLTGLDVTISGVAATVSGAVTRVPLGGSDWRAESQVFGQAANPGQRGDWLGRLVIPSVQGGSLGTAVRLMPTGDARVPVVVGRDMASVLALRVGDTVEFDGDWSSFTGRVAGIVPVIPGAANQLAAIVDLATMQSGALRVSSQAAALNTVWIASPDPAGIQASVARVAGSGATVTAASGALSARFLSSAVIGLWMGAIGSAAFALVALGGAIGATARRRAGEVTVLRAIGMSARQQGAARRTEVVVIVAYAVVGGLVGGSVVSLVTASSLARLSVAFAPAVLPVPFGLDVATLSITLLLLVAATAVITAWFARAVRHRAAEPAVRGGE